MSARGPDMDARRAVFVLGMHRSGTSALARVLNLLGASLPGRVLPAGPGNEAGHWEPAAAVALHDRLLDAAGTSVNGFDGPPEAWFATGAARAFLPPMRDLIREEFAGSRLFVFKDPRSALVFPLWREVLADLGIGCLPIVMLRDPAEVAASLVDRQRRAMPHQCWTPDRAGLLWLRYTLAAERHTRGGLRAFCGYAALLDDWRGVAERLGRDLGLAWPRPPGQAARDIDAFLDARLRHQHAERVPAARRGIWASWIGPAFDALLPAVASGQPDLAALDAVARSFTDACAAILPTSDPEPPRGVLPATIAQRGDGARRRLCLVVTPQLPHDDCLPHLAAVLDAAEQEGAAVTIVTAGAFPDALAGRLDTLLAARGIAVQPCAGTMPPVEPAFMAPTVAILRHLRPQGFDAVLFPDHHGIGHASIAAKRAGLDFADTRLGVIALGGARWRRENARRFPGDLVTLSVEHLERQAIEGAETLLLPVPEVSRWMREAGWQPAAAAPGTMRSGIADMLRPAEAPPGSPDAPGSVTVVITHFEQPRLLEQNLQALAQQTDRDFSVLVVDDGSRGEEALRYLTGLEERHRGLGLRLLRQDNRYLGAARNAGIRAAATEFVILLDDDNLAFPTMVEALRRAAHRMQADIVTCGIRHFHDATGWPEAAGQGPDQVFAGGPVLVGAVHNCFGDASGIYRRSLFDRVGGFHEQRGVTFEDWQLHLRAVAAGCRLVSLPEPLVWYRVRADSMLRTTHRYDNARVMAAAIRALPGSAMEPLADFLVGQEEEQARLNRDIAAVRAVAAAKAAALSETGQEASRRAVALEDLLAARTRDARAAEEYARSLEAALAEAQGAREAAAAYARSLEEARAEAEAYARDLEAELAKISGPAREP